MKGEKNDRKHRSEGQSSCMRSSTTHRELIGHLVGILMTDTDEKDVLISWQPVETTCLLWPTMPCGMTYPHMFLKPKEFAYTETDVCVS